MLPAEGRSFGRAALLLLVEVWNHTFPVRERRRIRVIEGMIDMIGRQRGCKFIVGELRVMREFWKLKEETLDSILWRM